MNTKGDMMTHEHLGAIEELSFFGPLPSWARERLAITAEEITLEPGEFAVHQHDEADSVYFLLSGGVQFLLRFEGVDDLLVGTTDEPGALISWSVFRAPYRNTASVRCETTCRLLKVPGAAFEEIFAEDPRLHYEILGQTAAVVADRLKKARDVLVLLPEHMMTEGASYE
ncbi:MAG: Crp/Fnr family transcriptional regulator [Rubrobacteraceae bacterium]